MRPVTVPANPPPGTYDENALLDVVVTVSMREEDASDDDDDPMGVDDGRGRGRFGRYPRKRSAVVRLMETAIDRWIGKNTPLNGRIPIFDDEEQFGAYLESLAAGKPSWGSARRALIGAIGQYCSFCGSAVFSILAIEHKLPKNTFPSQAFRYRNFLLACSSCNSAKGNRPNQATAPGHPLATAAAINAITNRGALNYYWSDFDWATMALPAQPFPFTVELKWMSVAGSQITFDATIEPHTQRKLLDRFKKGTLSMDRGLYFDDDNNKAFFGAAIGPRDGISDPQKAAVNAMIDLTSQNLVVPVSKSSNTIDRRIETRTKAYFTAAIVKEQLDLAAVTPGLLAPVLAQARTTITNTGHWLVWLTVFGGANYGGTPAQVVIRECFPGTSAVNWVV
jgi:5-methylcytosine-specific restriction endonuclease McrA